MTYMYLRVACALWESCKLASNDIRMKTVVAQQPSSCARHRGPLCCGNNGDIDSSRQQRISYSPKVNEQYVGQELVPIGESAWARNSQCGLPQSRAFSTKSQSEKFHIAVLLCTARKKNRKSGAGSSICNSPGTPIDTKVLREGSEQKLLDAAVLNSSLVTRESSPPSATRSPHQKGRSTQTPSFNHYCSNNNHNLYFWPLSRPRNASMSCELTAEGSSETASTEEYDMQIPKAQCGKHSIPRRVRVQYRVNSQRVLHSRKRVIRLLVVVLLTFAICVLPFHLKLVLMFWNIYPTPTSRMDILSPLAFVLLYMNSALNPILFWVFSDSFRRSLRDSFRRGCCKR
ncbi:neuropeptide FF receptor 1 [Elysia marginata]|uniref:Neuropeptide FF receptor 1 n=1 Tax=Elysia marginata TaxID=1093978 RepID=A0AAV4JL19_9GAST|nr:neuropeptide FF receptor 1 [Elysia marginata]